MNATEDPDGARAGAGPEGTSTSNCPVPAGSRLAGDASLKRYDDGRVLLGGSPLRLLRLGKAGARRVDGWLTGAAVGTGEGDRRLARQLLDAGLMHPVAAEDATTNAPSVDDVTLVVPVKDNPTGVARLLAATENLAERIVVDDGSTAPLLHARLRHLTPLGPAAARNAGWRLARTDLVAFLDADTEPEPGWLDAVLPLFADPQVVAVAPRVRSTEPGGTEERGTAIAGYETDRSSLDMGRAPAAVRPMSRVSYVPTAALVVRRSALSTVDGFDTALRFGEDVDLVWRLIAAGGTVRYQPESVVRHEPRRDTKSWLRQRFDYGTSAAPLADRHPGLLSCARLSPWSAAAWALACTGRPALGLAVAGVSTALLPRKLAGRGVPTSVALKLAAKGHLGAGRLLAEATRRAWWPLALLTRRGRAVLLAALLPCLVEAMTDGPDDGRIRWAMLRVADDLAYGAGVWAGCLRHRTLAPLLPQFTVGPGRSR